MLKLGRGAAIEPEVDLSGYWVDGDVVHIGRVRIGAGATVGARSTLMPGARIGKGAEIAAGLGRGRRGAARASAGPASPAQPRRPRRARRWPEQPPAAHPRLGAGVRRSRRWLLGLLPALAVAARACRCSRLLVRDARRSGRRSAARWPPSPLATVACVVGYALLVLGRPSGRSASACAPGTTRCTGGSAWQVVGDRAADGHGPGRAVPAVRQPVHAGVAAAARARRSAAAWRRPPCSRCRR